MALKDIFTMVKADRYTADGREELNKAREAETEDARRTYQIGEISQSTGLQKTANGWRPVKKGGAGAKAGPGKSEPKNVHGAEVDKIYERQLKRIKELKAKGFTDEQIDNDKIIKQTKEDMRNVGKKKENKPAAGPSRADKEAAIMADLDLREDQVEKLSDEVIEVLYKKSQMTPEQKKADFDNSKLGKAYNKQMKEYNDHLAAYKENQRKTNASTENKPEVKLGGGADTYYFEDPDSMSDEDKVFKSLGIELAETFGDHDGDPGNTETWANRWLDNIQNEGGLGIKSKKTRQPAAPVSAEEVMKIVEENPERWHRIIGNAKKFYEGKGKSTDFESDEYYPIKMVGGKTKPSSEYYAQHKRSTESKPAESEHDKRVDEYFKSIRKDKLSPVSRVAAELDRGTFDDDVRDTMGDGQSMEDLARSLISPAFEDDGYIPQDKLDTARKFILKRYKALESDATDSAPRVLTGDTKIRVRKA